MNSRSCDQNRRFDSRQEDSRKKKLTSAALRKLRRLRNVTDLRDSPTSSRTTNEAIQSANKSAIRPRSCTLPNVAPTLCPPSPLRSRSAGRNALSRLAASLHLPHYFGQGVITMAAGVGVDCKDVCHSLDNESMSVPFFGLKRKHGVNGQRTEYPCLYRTFSSNSPTEERIVQYGDHLDALVRCTSDDHADFAALRGHKEHIEQWMLRTRLDEIELARNEYKLDEIESQFPVDRLGLVQGVWLHSALRRALVVNSASTMNNVKQFVGRRKSIGSGPAPPSWFRNSNDGDNPSALTSDHKGMDGLQRRQNLSKTRDVCRSPPTSSYQRSPQQKQHQQHSKKTETFVRVYMKEGRVSLTTGVQSQERYLFLFSDLLLVAKENYRGINSYRLKERVRLCEVWLSDKGLDNVADTIRNPQHSFVVGWPTKSYVAEFRSLEERNSWYEMLSSTIASVKQKERPNTTVVNVKYKEGKIVKNCDISINNFQTSREMLCAVLPHFAASPAAVEEYQLWVQSGRETAAYPLHGHECPFAILLSHIRDLLPDCDGDVDVALLNDLTVSGHGIKCNFVVKKRRGSKKGKPSKHGAGQLVSHLKRKMKKQDSADSACPQSPTGKLFGIPLDALTESHSVPKPILALMEHLATEGAYMEGIFRKPPKNSTLRELKEKLDAGYEIDLVGVSPSVSASLLKEFFRQLPDSVLVNEKIDDWVSLCDDANVDQKLQKGKMLATQLPIANFRLLQYFLCLMRIVADRSTFNQMNSFNLGICVAPSLSGASRYGNLSGTAAKRMTELTQYLIDNAVELFGENTLTLLKAPAEQPALQSSPTHGQSPVLPYANGDYSDLFGHMKQETSSLDSLTAAGSSPSCSRPHSSLHQGAVHISRDSGLSESHGQADEFPSMDSVVSTSMQRCVSQSEDTEDDAPQAMTSHSVDNLAMMSTQKRTTRIVSDPDAGTAYDKSENVAIQNDKSLYRQKINIDSTDSIYESAESNSSMADYRQMMATTLRSSKRLPTAVLTRSASGDHLYLTERIHVDSEPSVSTGLVAQDLRSSRRHGFTTAQFSSFHDAAGQDGSPLTVMLTAGDSSYGSSPVSPESNVGGNRVGGTSEDSSQSCNTSPSPVPFMTRNSAYRRPARHRKGTAPLAPSPTNVMDDEDARERKHSLDRFDAMAGSTDASNDDEADSGVHVMDIHTARPIVISCNCESSSSTSSDEEKTDGSSRKNSIVPTPTKEPPTVASVSAQQSTPQAPVISEIYPLKSPSHNAWPIGATKFIVDSVPEPSKSEPVIIRRHSSRSFFVPGANEGGNVRHSLNDAAALTERISRGLELMMEKMENAHVTQEKLLGSHASESVNDSSTVTEASSEETTPHVSRESSSAQEYKQVAQVMFERPNSGHSKMVEDIWMLPPRNCQTLPIRKSTPRNDEEHFAPPVRHVVDCQDVVPSIFISRPSQSNYSSSDVSTYLPRYKARLINTSQLSQAAGDLHPTSGSSDSRSTTERVIPVRVVPMVSGQVRDRVQRYDREKLRRKTLGGAEFSALAHSTRHQLPSNELESTRIGSPPAVERISRYDQARSSATLAPLRGRIMKHSHPELPRSTSLDRRLIDLRVEEAEKGKDLADDEKRRQDISWSVRQYVEMFDGAKDSNRSSNPQPQPCSRYSRWPLEEKFSAANQNSSAPRGVGSTYLVSRLKPMDYRIETRRPVASRTFVSSIPSAANAKPGNPPSYVVAATSLASENQKKKEYVSQLSWHGQTEPTRSPGTRSGNSESYV